MEKEFVPYEIALRMKALGFNEPCLAWFSDRNIRVVGTNGCTVSHLPFNSSFKDDDEFVSAPTFSQAFRWFREKYNLYTEIHKKFDGIGVSIILSEYRYDHRQDKEVEYHIPKYFGNIHKSYEEAELACLKKLCEIVENKSE